MKIKIWGACGSVPSPMTASEYRERLSAVLNLALSGNLDISGIQDFISSLPDELKNIYGGNTTCVSLISDAGENFILDCGTGIRALGYELLKGDCGKGKGKLNIFLSHNHWDHIQGLPFFKPFYIKGNVLNFYSPYPNQKELLEGSMAAPYFPVSFSTPASIKNFHFIDSEKKPVLEFEGGLKVDVHPLSHPFGCFAYRFRENGKTFIFATDGELTWDKLKQDSYDDGFFDNADILILDSQYNSQDAAKKIDWGHTSYEMAVNCADRWKVKTLVLTHLEPEYSTEEYISNYRDAVGRAERLSGGRLKVLLAADGMEITL